MSAFVVSNVHIDALLTAGIYAPPKGDGPLRWSTRRPGEPSNPRPERTLTMETADAIGAMLVSANLRSVNTRYQKDSDEIGDYYIFRRLPGKVNPVVVIKAIRSYEYQSCESEDWPTCEAQAFCQELTQRMIECLPGYNDAPWEIRDRNVFVHRRKRDTVDGIGAA